MIDWTAIGAVATSITLIVIATTTILAYHQLKELRKQRQILAVLDLYNKLNDDTARKTRKLIYDLESTDKLIEQPEVRGKIESHLNDLNQTAYLIAQNFLPPYPTLEMLYITVVRCWVQLSDFIIAERSRKGIYMNHFQWLVEKSLEYWENEHPETQISIFRETTKQTIPISRPNLFTQMRKIRPVIAKHQYKIGP